MAVKNNPGIYVRNTLDIKFMYLCQININLSQLPDNVLTVNGDLTVLCLPPVPATPKPALPV